MDNLNLHKAIESDNKALDSELQDAHDNLINASSKQEGVEHDEEAGFMAKYSAKVTNERSVIK